MSASECVCSCMYKCESVFVYGYESEWECVCLCECINALESVYDCVRLCMNASESVYICVYMYLWFSILFSSLPSGDLQKLCPRKCSQWMIIFCFNWITQHVTVHWTPIRWATGLLHWARNTSATVLLHWITQQVNYRATLLNRSVTEPLHWTGQLPWYSSATTQIPLTLQRPTLLMEFLTVQHKIRWP